MKYLVSYHHITGRMSGPGNGFIEIDDLTQTAVERLQEAIRVGVRADSVVIMNLIPLTGEK